MATLKNVGPYRVLNLIRSGKNCDVYEVIDDAKGERRAIKLLHGEGLKNREEINLLKHEYAVGENLDHPKVIKIYDYVSDRDYVFLAMEMFPAPNVKQWIHQGVEALAPMVGDCLRQAAEGLGYLHSQGWVHRDVKPDNFLMDAQGEVRLIDFALAVKPAGFLGRLFGGRGKVQGTRSYMSPEQIRGEPLDERADIYSFGCVAHELVGGKPPYTGTSTNDLLNKHLRSAVPPLQASNSNVTEGFAQLVRRMLAKKREDRPQSLDDFVTELRNTPIFKVPPTLSKKT